MHFMRRQLPRRFRNGNVRRMHALARLLQLAGLIIPPLAMIAQLGNHISAGRMLQFLLFAVCLFVAGYLLQTYSGRGT